MNESEHHECLEWCPICRSADIVRASVPHEMRDQWRDMQREGLTILRAAIDHYIEYLDAERTDPSEPRSTYEEGAADALEELRRGA